MPKTRRQFLQQAAMAATFSAVPVRSFSQANLESLHTLSLAEAAARIRRGDLTSTVLVEHLLARIDVMNPRLNAFITVSRESALRQAAALDLEASAKRFRGPLHGVPIAIKDNIDTAGIRTTVGSMIFEDRVPTEDAFVVARCEKRVPWCLARLICMSSQWAALQ